MGTLTSARMVGQTKERRINCFCQSKGTFVIRTPARSGPRSIESLRARLRDQMRSIPPFLFFGGGNVSATLPQAFPISARTARLIASGRSGQAATTRANPGSAGFGATPDATSAAVSPQVLATIGLDAHKGRHFGSLCPGSNPDRVAFLSIVINESRSASILC
jgi:hypothetical protein